MIKFILGFMIGGMAGILLACFILACVDEKMSDYFRLLKKYKKQLTKQQYRTFKGQILSGDGKGFVKGLFKVLYGS